jgi:iron complex outermembrane receptor protein
MTVNPTSSLAQQAASPGVIEEIVVTARKRSESLQDVPFSIVAMTESTMRNRGIRNLEDVALNVAGFTIQNLGPGQSQIAIRGISAGQIVRDQPGVKEQVGVYLDESVISLSLFTPDIDLFDMSRIEVLRGPQGTLFGSGSSSGTVRFITNQPDLENTEIIAEVTGGKIDGGDFDGSIKAAINLPLAPGKAALRVVGYYNSIGGFIDAVQPGGSVNNDVNDGKRIGFRAALAFSPTENLRVTPRVIYQKIEVNGFNRVDLFNILANEFTTTRPAVTLGERQQFTQLEESFEDDFLLLDATVEYDMGPVGLTLVGSYTNRDVLVIRDTTQLLGSITAQPTIFNAPNFADITAPLLDATDVEVFTVEARVTSDSDGPLQWVLGAFYSDIERLYGQALQAAGYEDFLEQEVFGGPFDFQGVFPLAGVDEPFFSSIPYDFEQVAIFGEATYSFSDRLDVTAGLRWFDFKENRVLNFDGIFADQIIGLAGDTSSDGFSPRVIVSYSATDALQLNAQAAKGFRLGGINDPLNIPLCSPTDLTTFGGFDKWDNETVWNYEAGAKATILGGRGTLNVAAFYADISDLQVTLTAGSCSSRIIFNVPKARSIGVEAELFVRPTDSFEFAISASLTDSEFRSTVTSDDGAGNVIVLAAIEKGNRLPTVPKFQLAASSTYTVPQVWQDMDGFFTATVQHVGSRFTQAGDADPNFANVDLTITPLGAPSISTFTFDPKMAAYQIGNLRIGVRNDQWELAFFINNIWDEIAQLAVDQERGNRARVGFLTNQPRTFGVTARTNF